MKQYRDPITGGIATAPHHIFGGRFRKLSDKYGFIVWLSNDSHRRAHLNINESGKVFAKILQIKYNDIVLAMNTRDYTTLEMEGNKCREAIKKYEI